MQLRRLLFLVALGVGGAYLFRAFAFEGIYIASDSMAPAFPPGRHLFVNKWKPRFRAPDRGDVIVFHTPQNPGKGLVKRVIGLPGEVIELREKRVYINGEPIVEPYAWFQNPEIRYEGDTLPATQIPDGHLFVLGDNRDVSGDSRDWVDGEGYWSPFVPLRLVHGFISEP